MIAISLDPETEDRLERLAEKAGLSKDLVATQAIMGYLEDLEDACIAMERLEHPAKTYSAEEVKRELGLSL
ncbi:MAG: hypothetical protein JNK37_13690 [Verrucomicrobiales bacterium]|nr:hypothetical protein [Verrucomicrobiales bacterium]